MASRKGADLLKVFKALEAHPIIGISNKELADGLDIPLVNFSRHMDDQRPSSSGSERLCHWPGRKALNIDNRG